MAFTAVVRFTLADFGLPSAELWPQLWFPKGREWLFFLVMPGPGHEGLVDRAAIGFNNAGQQLTSEFTLPGSGQIALKPIHAAVSQLDDGTTNIYVDGLLVAPGVVVSVAADDLRPVQGMTVVRMAKGPSIKLSDMRTYAFAFSPQDVLADMQRPVAGWAWRMFRWSPVLVIAGAIGLAALLSRWGRR